MNAIKKTIDFGDQKLTIETGVIARQATGSVLVSLGDTTVLVTVVAEKESKEERDFFPLRVDYQERYYASGKIPGGFFKREGRPSERETLIARLIDRPIRPLFSDEFKNEVQVVASVLSLDPEIDPDIASMIGTSAALAISGVPFNGPLGAARVGYIDGQYVLNPTQTQLKSSQLDLVVAGTNSSVLMVESEAGVLSEEIMLGAVMFGHKGFQEVISLIEEFAKDTGTTNWNWQPPAKNTQLIDAIRSEFEQDLAKAYLIKDKQARYDSLKEIRSRINEKYDPSLEESDFSKLEVAEIVGSIEKRIVRERIIKGEPRIDGRDTKTVRPISIQTSLLPRTHGSALFTRGETQAIVTVTLGTARDAQVIDSIMGEQKDNFMLHYNFPPYSVGEIGMVGSPKRREIGHGKLAKRGVQAILPSQENCPYTIRIVSEITESNGSSSMASICGSSLALMDAGVPVKDAVAGIAMGLIKEDNGFAVISDILGDEDHLGDMDFKVAGTKDGVTALQMDIKIDGITEEIMKIALEQAKEGRIHILGEMNKAIQTPRSNMSKFAPLVMSFKINPDKIRDVIGKGGATIRSLTENTNCTVEIEDDGNVQIYADSQESGNELKKKIELLTAEVEVGKIYDGKVIKIVEFGAFVNILPGKDGLVHISQISNKRIDKVSDALSEGQTVKVKVLEIDRQGKVKLSMRALLEEEPVQESVG